MKLRKIQYFKFKKAQAIQNKSIAWIIGILVLALFISWFVFEGDINKWLKAIPDYISPNITTIDLTDLSDEQIMNLCPNIVAIVGPNEGRFFWTKKNHIYFFKGKQEERHDKNMYDETSLYWIGDEEVIKIKEGRVGSEVIARVDGRYFVVEDKYLSGETFEEDLPGQNLLHQLNGSYKIPGSVLICKSDLAVLETVQEQCEESCELHEGICKSSGGSEEISIGRIDCSAGKECYVVKNYENLKEGTLEIKDFKIILDTPVELFDYGANPLVLLDYTMRMLRISVDSDERFCYLLKTNKQEKIFSGNSEQAFSRSSTWGPIKGDEILELVAWNFKDASTEIDNKVIKRLKVEIGQRLPTEYEDGKIISDEDFKKEVFTAKLGSVFYVMNLDFDWDKTRGNVISTASNYRITVNDYKENWLIEKGKEDQSGEDDWAVLDCSQWDLARSADSDNLRDSLSETLRDSCKLK